MLPTFWAIVKIVVVTIILYPWYYAIKKKRSLDRVMNYVFLITPIPTPGMDNRTATSKNKIEEMMGSKTEF